MAVSDWSTTAASNTSVGGVSIAEGMSRASVNNAIRALMAEIAATGLAAVAVHPGAYGAVGDGVTDDGAALQAWIASGHKCLRADDGATYYTPLALTFSADDIDVDMQGSVIKPAAALLEPVIFGNDTTPPSRMNIRGISIDRTTTVTGTENGGFIYKAMNQSSVKDCESRFSKYNHWFKPTAGGCAYNNFDNLQGIDGFYNIYIIPSSTGYVNENLFNGGRFHDVGTMDTGIYIAAGGTYPPDNNVFVKPSIEGTATQAIYCNGDFNTFIMPRTEGTWSVADIVFGPASAGNDVKQALRYSATKMFIADYSTARSNSWDSVQQGIKRHLNTNAGNSPVLQLERSGSNVYAPTAAALSITGITAANPAVVTSAGHGLSNGQIVMLRKIGGMVELNNKFWKVNSVTTDTFELQTLQATNVDSSAFTAYTSGGYIARSVPLAVYEETYANSGYSHIFDFYIGRADANGRPIRFLRDDTGAVLGYFDGQGNLSVASKLMVAGTQVVGARGAAVTDPTGGATVDAEARTAIVALIDRLQAHGLIA